jgi:SAM-dependent methyltransferase
MRLNLGAGALQPAGYVHVDIAPIPGVDVVHDLDVTPWPWANNSAEEIIGKDIFEHVDNPIAFMTECHRVLQPGGLLRLQTPHWRSEMAFTDPTHRRFPTRFTWDYWIPDTALYRSHNAAYGGVSFIRVRIVAGEQILVELRKPSP